MIVYINGKMVVCCDGCMRRIEVLAEEPTVRPGEFACSDNCAAKVIAARATRPEAPRLQT